MQNKLLPCPFCGGEAKYIEDNDFFISRFVTCTKCGIETRRNYLRKDLAIKAWNTRKPMERIVEQLEEIYEWNDNRKKEAYEEQDWEEFDFRTNENRGIYTAIALVKGGVDNEE